MHRMTSTPASPLAVCLMLRQAPARASCKGALTMHHRWGGVLALDPASAARRGAEKGVWGFTARGVPSSVGHPADSAEHPRDEVLAMRYLDGLQLSILMARAWQV